MRHSLVGMMALAAALVASAAGAQSALKTGCAPMGLLVEGERLEKDTDAAKIGLTKETIQTAAEARLRAARIYEKSDFKPQYLYVNVNVVGRAFSISIELQRFLANTGYGESGYVTVWDTGGTGTHRDNATYILGGISRYLDKFIAAYLRENEATCK